MFDLIAHIRRQQIFSKKTFGPYTRPGRAAGVIDHIAKELCEVRDNPADLSEWIDIIILALDGAGTQGYTPEQIAAALEAKQTKNEGRVWPDWRTVKPGIAIEHDRSNDNG